VGVFCGIDWAETHHDIAVVDAEGRSLARRRIRDDAAGYQQLLQLLAEAGDTATDPIPVAIETGRGLLVAFLRATGRRVYAINPLAVSRYRDRHGVAGAKSDHGDAVVLAGILRTDPGRAPAPAGRLRTGPGDHGAHPAPSRTRSASRQQLANQLRSLLREFFPAALAAFHPKARRPDRPGGPRRAHPPRRPRPRQRA
jgi:transposase